MLGMHYTIDSKKARNLPALGGLYLRILMTTKGTKVALQGKLLRPWLNHKYRCSSHNENDLSGHYGPMDTVNRSPCKEAVSVEITIAAPWEGWDAADPRLISLSWLALAPGTTVSCPSLCQS